MQKLMKLVKSSLGKGSASEPIKIQVKYKDAITTLSGKPGDNIMRLLSSYGNEKFEVFGLCDCQLACTTCSVHLNPNHLDKFPLPSDEELDILSTLNEYYPDQTRMSCQLSIPSNEQLKELSIELPSKINYTSDIYNLK